MLTANEEIIRKLVRQILVKDKALKRTYAVPTIPACLTGGKVAYLNMLSFIALKPERCL